MNHSPVLENALKVARFDAEGFSGPFRLYAPEEAAAYRARFFEVLEQSEEHPVASKVNMSAWHHRYRWAYEIATKKAILDLVEPVLGPDIVLWAMHFWYKEPGNGKRIPWHQDGAYWHMHPKKNVTVWVALGPTFAENGCLRIIPGTHKKTVDHDAIQDKDSWFANGLPASVIDESKALNLELEPGEAVVFNESTFHGSTANTSSIARVAFSLRFTSPDVKFEMEKWSNAERIRTYLLRGKDRFGLNDAIRGEVPVA